MSASDEFGADSAVTYGAAIIAGYLDALLQLTHGLSNETKQSIHHFNQNVVNINREQYGDDSWQFYTAGVLAVGIDFIWLIKQ